MKSSFIIISLCILFSCSQEEQKSEKTDKKEKQTEQIEASNKEQFALDFIHDYLSQTITKTDQDKINWMRSRRDVSDSFKHAHKDLLEKARKEDPDMGLGFDPILNAQDHPNAFEIASVEGNYILLQGKDWPDFKLAILLNE